MRRELLRYELPEELIAARPAGEREDARLLVMGAGDEVDCSRKVGDLDRVLAAGSLLVVNDTKVVPARLLGLKEGTGGKVEIFLVRRLGEREGREGGSEGRKGGEGEAWLALGRSSKPLREGARIAIGEGRLSARIEGARGVDGLLEVTLTTPSGEPVEAAIEALGHVPLPPYIRRPDEAADRARYQTVFARVPGAIAAPTAGLHLSRALLDRLLARGVSVATVTLHVGLGTFQPVTADDLDDHPMHAERFEVPLDTAGHIASARSRGAPVVAVGTTVVRALESAADPERPGHVRKAEGETRLLIQPGYAFRVVDALLTNFHLPESTLLALVCAFAGRERVLAAYAAAVRERFRFYSYGDAMLIAGRAKVAS